MNISLRLLGRFDLDDKVDAGNIETTGSDISGNQHAEFLLLKALKGDFSLVLRNITVHDLDVFLDLLSCEKFIGFLLGRSKDNGLTTAVN